MPRHGKIKYRNVFYMLTYSPEELEYIEVEESSYEKCSNTLELLGMMMCKAYEILARNGRFKQYRKIRSDLKKPHGRIDMKKSIENSNGGRTSLVCDYSSLDMDNELNRLVKSAINYIIEANKLSDELSDSIIDTLLNMRESLKKVNHKEFNRKEIQELKSRYYPSWCKPALNTSIIILEMLLFSDEGLSDLLFKLDDEHRLCYIFEKFVRRYIRDSESKLGVKVTHYEYDDGYGNIHRPDIVVNDSTNNYIVIDTKWYAKTNEVEAQTRNKSVVAQYMKRVQEDKRHTVENIIGLLLYAEKQEGRLTKRFNADKENREVVDQLSLNLDDTFENIKLRIDNIVREYLEKRG